MSEMTCYLNGVGMVAPGVEDWPVFTRIVVGEEPYSATEPARYTPQSLPANERRRASQLVRLAFNSIEQLVLQLPAEGYATVFSSSGGDYDIFHKICTALALPEKIVSPTQFHNSVHNAPAGYWSIATGNTHPSTTISAHDFSFVMGLVDAVAQLQGEAENVLLACYDMVPPSPINEVRNVAGPFSTSLLLSARANEHTLCALDVSVAPRAAQVSSLAIAALETLRLGNASARSLSLLTAIARAERETELALSNGESLCIGLRYSGFGD